MQDVTAAMQHMSLWRLCWHDQAVKYPDRVKEAGAYPVLELNVGEALGLAGVAVHDDLHIHHLACLGEEFKQVTLLSLEVQIVSKDSTGVPVQFHQFALPLALFLHLWWRLLSHPAWHLPSDVAISGSLLRAFLSDSIACTLHAVMRYRTIHRLRDGKVPAGASPQQVRGFPIMTDNVS